MENKIDSDKVRELLQHICSYELFIKSTRYTHFLKYLVEQALAGNDLKEHTIGLELFERNYNENKNDGIVRVYMYNLRKKLNSYYSDVGKNDTFIFILEKGSYNLKFIPNKNTTKQPKELYEISYLKKLSKRNIFWGGITLVLIFFTLNYYLFFNEKNYCWEMFLAKHSSTTCVLADQVLMLKKNNTNHGSHLYLNTEINSSSDFISYTKKHTTDSLKLLYYTYYTKAIPYSVHKLSRFFTQHNQDFSHIPESELRYEDTKINNIIYIGQFKTMSVSKELFLRNSKVFKAYYNRFEYIKNGKIKRYVANFKEGGVRAEYAMVSYVSLNNGNKALYFVSNHDIGTMATINKFTDPAFLKQFYKNLSSPHSYFNALFKVEGVNRSETSCELVKLEILEE